MPFFFFLTGCSKASSSLSSSVVWICKWWVWSFFSFAADFCMCEVIYAIGSCPTHLISLGNNNHNPGSTGYVRAHTQQSKASNPIRQMLDSGWWMWCSHGDNEIIYLSLHFGSTLNAQLLGLHLWRKKKKALARGLFTRLRPCQGQL